MPRQVLSLFPLPTPEATRSPFVVWQRGKIGRALRTWLDLIRFSSSNHPHPHAEPAPHKRVPIAAIQSVSECAVFLREVFDPENAVTIFQEWLDQQNIGTMFSDGRSEL